MKLLAKAAFNSGYCGDVLATQRRLRAQLLDRPAVRHAKARDLAAHMLLNIDDLNSCWSLAAHWLRVELACHRVDAGFGVPGAREYYPGFVEAKHDDYDVPSFEGGAVYNFDPVMRSMWHDEKPIALTDIKQDNRVTSYLRQRISGARTKSKIGGALRTGSVGYGLICADWTEHFVPHKSDIFDCFEQTVADVLSPIIAVSKAISEHDSSAGADDVAVDPTEDISLEVLTASELEVAKLVAQGMSYKEIARIRRRSFSTIDHQLRSIRHKTGVHSTSALVSLLAKLGH
ncbi:MAG: helix-turn-helix transcriptional regulator [Pseudomonadota bacterium]